MERIAENSDAVQEEVMRTYKQFDGYHPIFSYIGREGYLLTNELREGNRHCQNGTPEYLKRAIGLLNQLEVKTPVVFKLDRGNDTRETLKVLDTSGHFFVVKRNLRTEPVEYWLSVALSEVTI